MADTQTATPPIDGSNPNTLVTGVAGPTSPGAAVDPTQNSLSATSTTSTSSQPNQFSNPAGGATTSTSTSQTITSTAPISGSASGSSISSSNSTASKTTTSSSITASPAPSTSSKGISGGAVAGTAIGCIIAGLALGFIIAWLIFRRRNKKPPVQTHELGQVGQYRVAPEPKQYDPVSVITHLPTSDVQLDQFLLDGAPDNDIALELRSLDNLIYQHVESHYFLQPTKVGAAALTPVLRDLGFARSSATEVEAIAALCIEPRARYIGLRHVISTVVFRSVDARSQNTLSMLPVAVAAFLRSMPSTNRHQADVTATSLAFSKWRNLSAFLLHPKPAERTPLRVSEAEVSPQAQVVVNALNMFLQHFVLPDETSRYEQTNHLRAVLIECAKLGYELFSHPSNWQFIFERVEATQKTTVMVCPGLNKISQRDGRPYKSPQQVVEPSRIALL